MELQTIMHLHMGFGILFLLTYVPKSILFLSGNNSFLPFKQKTFLIETIFSVLFLLSGAYLLVFRIKAGYPPEYHKWLDPKITLALLAIPLGIVGFKKANKTLVALSLLFFLVALTLGLLNFK
ncbi:MAG: SirB2 family protein [Sphingobacteriales bacterium]|nr:MAG: SirB2 family protein [Sphingobacteriales bacterium]